MTSESITSLLNKDVGRHVKQGKICAVEGVGHKRSTLKPGRLVSVTACQGKAAVCQGLEVLPPDIFAPQRDSNLHRHPGYCAEGIPLPRVLCGRSCRAYRSSGYGYKTPTEFTEVSGRVARAYRTNRSSGQVQKCCTRTPGIVKRVVQNLQKFRVRV